MTLTKFDIVERVAQTCGYSKLEAAELVETVFKSIKDSLNNGENVKISGFGNFVLRDKRARMGRNPQSGEAMEIYLWKGMASLPNASAHVCPTAVYSHDASIQWPAVKSSQHIEEEVETTSELPALV